mmetsp:Transcript_12769/g.51304  ORF Transcript_12769/g.51304 Transcript_12769/m.51304 type:complete len:80 (+) Transcript_12769:143-382(+)
MEGATRWVDDTRIELGTGSIVKLRVHSRPILFLFSKDWHPNTRTNTGDASSLLGQSVAKVLSFRRNPQPSHVVLVFRIE